MRGWKRLFFAVQALTLVGGLGIGAFVATLSAAPELPASPSVERRVGEYREAFDLDASQARRLREVLERHDAEARAVRERIDEERFRELQRIHERAREELRGLLDERQTRILDGMARER